MDILKFNLTKEQAAAAEHILSGGKIDGRLVDLSEIMRQVCREYPDLLAYAVQVAARQVHTLAERFEDIYQLLKVGDRKRFEEIIEPITRLINASTNGLDKKISKDYFSQVGKINERITQVLMLGAVQADKRKDFAEEFDEILNLWVNLHGLELIMNYGYSPSKDSKSKGTTLNSECN